MCGIFAVVGNYDKSVVINNLNKIQHRGPDHTNYVHLEIDNVFIGFHRLKIMDTSDNGNQPFDLLDVILICNGEIYNYKDLKKKYNITTKSDSDCEIILHLYKKIGILNTVKQLDGVFSFFLYDKKYKQFFVGRDYIGVRPLFIGCNKDYMTFSSEVKAIDQHNDYVKPFPPGNCMINHSLTPYFEWNKITKKENICLNENTYCDLIKFFLENAVEKRMMSNRPIGCFLSGGLDSSLICSLVKKFATTDIHTFSIGMENSEDLIHAKNVADFLQTHHHEITFTFEDAFNVLENVIQQIESYDVTTVRASIPQYLLSHYISSETDIVVVFSGEGADEHFAGYRYLQYAASDKVLDKELFSLMRNLHQFDVLRTDRTTAKFGLEVRVPFLDKQFVKYSMSIPTTLKLVNNERMEKYILRKAFDNEKSPYLPSEVLWRRKEAFSDSVGSDLRTKLIEKINTLISDDEFTQSQTAYSHNPPQTKEALYYRRIFDKHYTKREHLISKYWMPNKGWFEETLTDPSAHTIPNII